MGKRINIPYGEKIGEWEVHEYIGNGKYSCTCSCGNIKSVAAKSLKNGTSKSCGHAVNIKVDLSDKEFGEWKVLHEADTKGKWVCKCSCGVIKVIDGHELRRGNTKSCGHSRIIGDLKGKRFGEWEVLDKADKDRYWTCKCSCGTIKDVIDYSLVHGKSTSCGHGITKYNQYNPGDKFGELTLIRQVHNQIFEFKCSCGNIRQYNINSVVGQYNNIRSCGCKSNEIRLNTLIDSKGDFKNQGNLRDKWQIDVLSSREKLIEYLSNVDNKSSREEVAEQLDITRTGLYEAAQRYKINLDNYICARNRTGSPEEKEIIQFIKNIYTDSIMCNTRKIIYPKELDVYIPDKKIAIEFNGDYWHSDTYKNKYYHQEKTIACAKQGIQLIHIFEHEWRDIKTQYKIKQLLIRLLTDSKNRVFGRKTEIREISKEDAKNFCNKYHLQGHSNCEVQIGCYYNNELVGVMTFGKPRFNNRYEYEIIRLCWKDSVNVIGGTEKLFKYFINKYKPNSIITYADISKFTGNIYSKLGFKVIEITKPNYKWINPMTNSVISRYQAQKHKLIESGIATETDTEDTAMKKVGYMKIYDCGNIKFEWFSNTNNEIE